MLGDGSVLVAGGWGKRKALASVEIFDPASDAWSSAEPMHDARAGHIAARLPDGRVLVVGGSTVDPWPHAKSVNSAEVFDPATGHWTLVGAPAESPFGSWAMSGGRVVVQVYLHRAAGDFAVLSAFDPATGTWSRLGRTPTLRIRPVLAALPDGSILVAGGSWPTSELPSPTDDAWLFHPATATWEELPKLHIARFGHVASVLSDGRILITSDDRGEILDPATKTWSLTAVNAGYRTGHAAVVLQDGRVLIAGASFCGEGNIEKRTEIYDPGSDSWLEAGRIPYEDQITASVLLDGRVLITGGSSSCEPGGTNDTGPFSAALLLDPSTIR